MNIVSYGGGANSTALLVGLHQHRIPVDLILFADTGAEHPHTYAYLNIMDRWLKDHGMPPITRVYKYTQDGMRLTLEGECLQSCAFIQGQSSQIEREPFLGGLCVSDYILLLTHQKALVVHSLCSVYLLLMYEKLCILVKILVWVYEK